MIEGYSLRSGTILIKPLISIRRPTPQPVQTEQFGIDVHLRRNSDGEVRVYRDEYGSGWKYQYGDGNFGCDCNRHLFFCRATGEGDEEDRDCGMEAYTVVKIVRVDTGEVLAEDDPREVPA